MNTADYDWLRQFLKTRSGLVLSADKMYLVESRLTPVARRHGLDGLGALVSALRGGRVSQLEVDVVEAMTTNETLFFRDRSPFDLFRETMVPALLGPRAAARRLRIWCAAASTGQEPYSLAMTIREMPQLAGWRVEILATDLSTEVLEKAKAGLYTQFEVQRGLPIQQLVRHFTQEGDTWRISPELRGMIQWRPLNLLADFSPLGPFDIVFCRNVLIYFDQETKADVLRRISRVVTPDGFLVLGAAETVIGLSDSFRPVPDRRGLYAPNVPASATATPRLAVVAGGR